MNVTKQRRAANSKINERKLKYRHHWEDSSKNLSKYLAFTSKNTHINSTCDKKTYTVCTPN